MKLKVVLIACLAQFYVGMGTATAQNDIPSCYAANKVNVNIPASKREIFVLIDQTTKFDDRLKKSIFQNVGSFISSGNSFVIASFSSYAQGRYLSIHSAGVLEPQVSEKERNNLSISSMKKVDRCLVEQIGYGKKVAGAALTEALNGAASDIANSDIIGSLHDFSKRVRTSNSSDKVVFLASDMLENSSISSFYSKKTVRKIDAQLELKKISSANMFGDFGGAKVYVLGAGLMQEDSVAGAKKNQGIYRDPKTISLLREFWGSYFEKSNAKLLEFGAPELMNPVF